MQIPSAVNPSLPESNGERLTSDRALRSGMGPAEKSGSASGSAAGKLLVTVRETFDHLSISEWTSLFPDHPDPFENVRLIATCGMDTVSFRNVTVTLDGVAVLVIPSFLARFDAVSMAKGRSRSVLKSVSRVVPSLLRPRLCGIGLVECEWGAVGIREGVPAALLARAWELGMRAVEGLARENRSDVQVMLDIHPGVLERLPGVVRERFAPADTSPCARVPLPFASLDAYFASLSRSTRQRLRRRMRAGSVLRVERTTEAGAHLPRMIELYRETVARSPVVLGVQRAAYFERVCGEVPGAHYVLYFLDEELLAFNLVIAREGVLIDKYFCMNETVGREHNLYFVSWVENVRYCIENMFHTYHAGPGAEGTKSHLGCEFVRTHTLFRHRSLIAHAVLARLAKWAGSRPEVSVRDSAEDES